MKIQIVLGASLEGASSETEFKNAQKSYEDVFKKLEHVGITFSFKKYFSINFDEDVYNSVVSRGAGRKRVEAVSEKGHPVTYASVLLMMKNMTDYEIMDKISMKKATYYRHKKAMLESDWYKDHAGNLDLNDPEFTEYFLRTSPVF